MILHGHQSGPAADVQCHGLSHHLGPCLHRFSLDPLPRELRPWFLLRRAEVEAPAAAYLLLLVPPSLAHYEAAAQVAACRLPLRPPLLAYQAASAAASQLLLPPPLCCVRCRMYAAPACYRPWRAEFSALTAAAAPSPQKTVFLALQVALEIVEDPAAALSWLPPPLMLPTDERLRSEVRLPVLPPRCASLPAAAAGASQRWAPSRASAAVAAASALQRQAPPWAPAVAAQAPDNRMAAGAL